MTELEWVDPMTEDETNGNNSGVQELFFRVQETESGQRLDKYLTQQMPTFSRAYLQKLIAAAQIRVNDTVGRASYLVRAGDSIAITVPSPTAITVQPEPIPLDIRYEDEDVMVVNKPKGMVVHPAPGHEHGTLVNALLQHCGERLSGINGQLRPGIVHRIDRDTTGLLLVCKYDLAHRSIAEQLQAHTINRRYTALAFGKFAESEGSVNAPIGRHPTDRKKMAIVKNGRYAVTHYQVLESLSHNVTLLQCRLETGRTHQIRVHLASLSHPLLGDPIYGDAGRNARLLQALFQQEKSHYAELLNGQALHAGLLGFCHPRTDRYLEFEVEPPEAFQTLLERLRGR